MLDALVLSNVIHWVITLMLIVLNYALVRQIGVLYERVAPAGALMIGGKYQVGDRVSPINVETIHGEKLVIGDVASNGMSTLVLFVSPFCPMCKQLLPALKGMLRENRKWLSIVLASDGDINKQRVFIDEHSLQDFPYVLSAELGMGFEVGQLPYAVLINEEAKMVSKGLVNSREHLESLIEAKVRNVTSLQQFMEERHLGRSVASVNPRERM